MKNGPSVPVAVLRDGQRVTLAVAPEARKQAQHEGAKSPALS